MCSVYLAHCVLLHLTVMAVGFVLTGTTVVFLVYLINANSSMYK